MRAREIRILFTNRSCKNNEQATKEMDIKDSMVMKVNIYEQYCISDKQTNAL